MSLKTCLTSLLLVSLPFAAHATTYYKSIDENGNVQYTQTKPKNTETVRHKINASQPDNSSTYKRPSLKSDDKGADKKSEETADAKEAETKLTPEQKKKGCAKAQSNMATMQSKGQIRQVNKAGETRYLSEQEKQARIKQTQDLIKKHCK